MKKRASLSQDSYNKTKKRRVLPTPDQQVSRDKRQESGGGGSGSINNSQDNVLLPNNIYNDNSSVILPHPNHQNQNLDDVRQFAQQHLQRYDQVMRCVPNENEAQNYSDAQLEHMMLNMHDYWITDLNEIRSNSHDVFHDTLNQLFNSDAINNNADVDNRVESIKLDTLLPILNLKSILKSRSMFEPGVDNPEAIVLEKKTDATLAHCMMLWNIVEYMVKSRFISEGNYNDINTACNTFFNILPQGNENDMNIHRKELIMHILELAQNNNYRRYNTDYVMRQRYVTALDPNTNEEKSYGTHYWYNVMSIRDFITQACNKDFYYKQWDNYIKNANSLEYLVKYLEEQEDLEFPKVVHDRHIFAANNGLYITCANYFTRPKRLTFFPPDWGTVRPDEYEWEKFAQRQDVQRKINRCRINYMAGFLDVDEEEDYDGPIENLFETHLIRVPVDDDDSPEIDFYEQVSSSDEDDSDDEDDDQVASMFSDGEEEESFSTEKTKPSYEGKGKRPIESDSDDDDDDNKKERKGKKEKKNRKTDGKRRRAFREEIKYPDLVDLFIPYGSKLYNMLPSSIVASKYFDMDFDPEYMSVDTQPDQIDTPCFEKIFDYQKIPTSAKVWIWALLGKNFYDIEEIDNWQCSLSIKGVPGSGKSTILKAFSIMYEYTHQATVSASLEKQFGIEQFKDKFINICYESKGLGIPLGQLASMISGETVSVATKFKKAKTATWVAPFIFAGDGFMYGKDSDCMLRRMITVEFNTKVDSSKSETDLLSRICNREVLRLMLKFNRAYLLSVNMYGKKEIWSVIDPYFEQTRQNMNNHINPLVAYLESKEVFVIKKDAYVPFNFLKKKYQEHCKYRQLQQENSDKIYNVLQTLGLTVQSKSDFMWLGRYVEQEDVIVGLSYPGPEQEINLQNMPGAVSQAAVPPPPPIQSSLQQNNVHDDDDDTLPTNFNVPPGAFDL